MENWNFGGRVFARERNERPISTDSILFSGVGRNMKPPNSDLVRLRADARGSFVESVSLEAAYKNAKLGNN